MVDASNAFNCLNRQVALHNIQTLCPPLANIKTHDSESRGQEEAGRTRRTSVLFTGSTTLEL